MTKSDHSEPAVVVTKAYDLLLWLLPKTAAFARTHKFTIGDRLATAGLELLLALVDAAYASDKSRPLEQATRQVNAVRYLLRLSKDLHLLTVDSYGFASERLEEVGRMAGGWQKAARGRR
jgi:hypothetical protein